ncbi:MAG TPA: HAD family hydrolase [Vicinamibacteria bacterium]
MKTTLIIDADDTLWENNVHFESATEEFFDLVEQRGGSREAARRLLPQIERRNIPIHGYGSRGFSLSLMEALEEVTGTASTSGDRELILALGDRVRKMPIEFLPGVLETLVVLKEEHHLILFTKGDRDEQRDKVERSGAAVHFHHVEITSEKLPADYLRLLADRAIDRDLGWMVGNSPRSDINPALEVGLGAVYIPHPRTWSLEHEEVRAANGGRLKILKKFSELLDHFRPRT